MGDVVLLEHKDSGTPNNGGHDCSLKLRDDMVIWHEWHWDCEDIFDFAGAVFTRAGFSRLVEEYLRNGRAELHEEHSFKVHSWHTEHRESVAGHQPISCSCVIEVQDACALPEGKVVVFSFIGDGRSHLRVTEFPTSIFDALDIVPMR
ncbi:MAG: hypothetical protein ABIG71_02340 [Candidatus Uhrbacteria bacterium]